MIITKEQRAEIKTTAQVVEWVKAHAREQGCKARVANLESGVIHCMYRTSDGKACFVGCLITNEEYRDKFEGIPVEGIILTIDELDESSLEDLREFLKTHEHILDKLQNIHDFFPVEAWEEEFATLA